MFLDRDGVINRAPPQGGWVLRWEDFSFAPGALDALRQLHQAGFTVAVITNQSCVARGLVPLETVQASHARMVQAVSEAGGRIAGVYVCPHVDEDQCPCRKPKPGLIDQAARELALHPARAFLVGDSERDIQAGRARGATTFLLHTPGCQPEKTAPDYIVSDLLAAVTMIRLLVDSQDA